MSRPTWRFSSVEMAASERAVSRPMISSGRTRFCASRSRSRSCLGLSPLVFPVTAAMAALRSGWGLVQQGALPGVRGKGITSRMFCMPVTNCTSRSKPRPKPACGTLP